MKENDPELAYRWSTERAQEWFDKHGWMVGCNYVPHNAINQLEMWQAETFDPFLIDKELGWAAGLGFNTVRRCMGSPSKTGQTAGTKTKCSQFRLGAMPRVRCIE
jgi:hypothetical protein